MQTPLLQPALQWSGALSRRTLNDTDFMQWLQIHCEAPITDQRIRTWLEELGGQPMSEQALATPDCRRVLRKLRERVFYGVMVRDLAGLASLEEVTRAMTSLADLAIAQAYRSVMAQLCERHGHPVDPDTGRPQEMIIVGMGKLGGRELNVSSDIDLIMLYGEEGETSGSRPISHHEFYGKLTRMMMPILSEPDENGQVFRTDLRLRPDGDSGPLAWSLDAFEHYLFTQGREWERYAWLKGRVIEAQAFADSESTVTLQHVESMRLPFVYRKYFDFDALSALRDLRERIRQDWNRKASARTGVDAQHNIKLGDGGIREIEFVVQLTQLIRGGKMPALQKRGLLSALSAQVRSGVLPAQIAHSLKKAYVFLRQVEHALQYREDGQTHLLPSDEMSRASLAQALRMEPRAFEAQLAEHRRFVEATFRDAFRLAGLTGSHFAGHPLPDTDPLQENGADPAQAVNQVAEDDSLESMILLFGASSEQVQSRIDAFLDGHRIRSLSAHSRTRVDELLPLIINASLGTSAPQTTCFRLLDLIETIAQRSAYLALLVEFPATLVRVAMLMAASPWAAQYVIQHPVVLDSLIDWTSLMESIDFIRLRENLQADLDASMLPDGQPDVERQMNLMRDLQRQVSFQLLSQDLAGVLSVESLADNLSALADTLLEQALIRTWKLVLARARLPYRDPQFAIIAYGKLGGKELGYSSDLDLVFIYDDDNENAQELYTRLAGRLTSWLSTMTSSGRLYEVDMRLRPDGDAGLMAVSVESFEAYQLNNAWSWEHQALTRARFAAGDPVVGQQFEKIRERILTLTRDALDLATKVREMRQKISAGHPNRTELFDLKHDEGGMVDLEFVTQYLVLLHAHQHPELVPNLGNIALLRISGELGLIQSETAREAIEAYRVLRKRQHELRLQGQEKARVAPEELASVRLAVRTLWKEVLGN
ncbi:bifunctional [glutamate--ammonia ligase]-adenylyl-L-tyrosine phosphorylase/[glutamate--ammonia-ligase] adenylyltransferase [Orrella marina]|uniref:Bifunctional glutamine synthetase adenylyltransferase/adenylyl-removing enzyme n=1 Tax=Orrella marina TaxID=2163011 RepID=A0A2R4XIB0_9BURK|nr:bifunctional [glutamate--ammonia ligase]-adenylyl-L-tyrosine phosphorylase/[glutamate--ammonia-ligase] adenylyltransferase [Orrella marina]AWB33531.1 bifunctional [glutamate--ammonia ligase]-adenylyl-L-tyrosine phosphorylase/[glutamate--ammonia-ligase] adenylyltransferase [Orrella marina]